MFRRFSIIGELFELLYDAATGKRHSGVLVGLGLNFQLRLIFRGWIISLTGVDLNELNQSRYLSSAKRARVRWLNNLYGGNCTILRMEIVSV